MLWGEERFTDLVGKRVLGVDMDKAHDRVVFWFMDGTGRAFTVSGDCCSHSWIEHLELPRSVLGATLLSVDDSASVNATNDDALNPVTDRGDDYISREHECLQVYHTVFRTDRGDIVLEYRNSSNGYYGGSLDVDEDNQPASRPPPLDMELKLREQMDAHVHGEVAAFEARRVLDDYLLEAGITHG